MAYDSEKTAAIFPDIIAERAYQESLVDAGKFKWTCADNNVDLGGPYKRHITFSDKLSVLGEEFGEVAREVTEDMIAADRIMATTIRGEIRKKLRKELIQTAAVAIAWIEAIDAEAAAAIDAENAQ